MPPVQASMQKCVRWVYEFLFSLNFAWAFEWLDRSRERPGLFPWMEYSPFLQRLHGYAPIHEPGTVLEQVVWSFVLALLMFPLIRLLAWLAPTRGPLRITTGAFALAGFPLIYLRFSWTFFPGSGTRGPWFILETLVVLLCGMLYYVRKWAVPVPVSVLLLILHFSLWSRVAGTYVNLRFEIQDYGLGSLAFYISTIFYFGFPVLGLLSSLAWALYVRPTENASSPAH